MWTLAYGQHEDQTPTHGYAVTRAARAEAGVKPARQTQSKVPTRHFSATVRECAAPWEITPTWPATGRLP
jgi:hypothetical protein